MLKTVKGPNTITQEQHLDSAQAKKVIGDLLVPGTVVPPATDISAAAIQVGKGNILRIRVAAQTYVAFSADPALGAVSATTSPGIELNTAGVYLVVATEEFVRASANPARLEIIGG